MLETMGHIPSWSASRYQSQDAWLYPSYEDEVGGEDVLN